MRLKQYNTGTKIGGFLDTLSRSQAFIAPIAYATSFGTFYVVAADKIRVFAPWFNFPVFIVLVVLGTILVMVFVWMIVTPSAISYFNSQLWKHDSPTQKDLMLIKKRLGISNDATDVIDIREEVNGRYNHIKERMNGHDS